MNEKSAEHIQVSEGQGLACHLFHQFCNSQTERRKSATVGLAILSKNIPTTMGFETSVLVASSCDEMADAAGADAAESLRLTAQRRRHSSSRTPAQACPCHKTGPLL